MGMFDNKKGSEKESSPQNQSSGGYDPFAQIASSTPSQGGVYPVPGIYPVLYCDALKMKTSRKNEDLFIAEFDIVESEVDERAAGTRFSWVVNFKHDASAGNVKGFLAALMGISPDEVDSEGAKFACSEENPCHGKLVRLEATNTVTKAGNDFTLCRWSALPKEVQEQAASLREAAGFTPF